MSIFRKVSLDRLSSPEQLDLLLQVTTPKGWLALLGLAGLLMAAIVWSVLGSIPTRVRGMGILVNKGGLSSVGALASGQLMELSVVAGAEVKKGQVIAKLALPDLSAELRNTRATLETLESQDRQMASFGTEDTRLQSDALSQRRASAIAIVTASHERQAMLAGRGVTQKKLFDEGLITEQVLQATREGERQAGAEAARAQGELKELSVKDAELRQRVKQENSERAKRIDEMRRKAADLEEKINANSLVLSPSDGRVIEVRAATGSLVGAGTPLVMIELAGHEAKSTLEAIVYVPGVDGKKVHKEMAGEVSPSTVKQEEFGSLRARVTSVSEFPSTQQAMLANLGNQDLVATFSHAIETPIELHLDVTPSATTPSGYAWTSPKGPPSTVQPGTLCAVSITVRERAPISLVIPLLKEKLGL